MKLEEDGWLLRVFCGEDDRAAGMPLYEALVREARERGFAGATVLRGSMGFGARSRLHTAKLLRLSEDLPIVVEIVETRTRIDSLLPYLDEIAGNCLVTLEKVRVIRYRGGKG